MFCAADDVLCLMWVESAFFHRHRRALHATISQQLLNKHKHPVVVRHRNAEPRMYNTQNSIPTPASTDKGINRRQTKGIPYQKASVWCPYLVRRIGGIQQTQPRANNICLTHTHRHTNNISPWQLTPNYPVQHPCLRLSFYSMRDFSPVADLLKLNLRDTLSGLQEYLGNRWGHCAIRTKGDMN